MRTRARAAAALLCVVALAGLHSAHGEGEGAQTLPAWHPRRFSHRRVRDGDAARAVCAVRQAALRACV
jgi:hypothetical protein